MVSIKELYYDARPTKSQDSCSYLRGLHYYLTSSSQGLSTKESCVASCTNVSLYLVLTYIMVPYTISYILSSVQFAMNSASCGVYCRIHVCISDDLHITNRKIILWPELIYEIFVKVSYGSCFAVWKNQLNTTCRLSAASQMLRQRSARVYPL